MTETGETCGYAGNSSVRKWFNYNSIGPTILDFSYETLVAELG